MNKTTIEWCDYTWNPIVGCLRGCKYCYAARNFTRFGKRLYGPDARYDQIHMFWGRLEEPLAVKKSATIFVGSMSDPEYWDSYKCGSFLNNLFQTIARCPQHTFMFLSKSPIFYFRHKWAENTMQGITVESYYRDKDVMNVAAMACLPRPFVSYEPVLGDCWQPFPKTIKQVIVGAMTGPGAVIPEQEWIYSIKKYIPKQKLFLKESIKPYWKKGYYQLNMFG